MLSEKLKEATKTNHHLLEKKLITHIKAIRTKEDYAALLALFYSFFGGMEKKINQEIDTTQLPDYAQRRKATTLAEDLTQLGAEMPPLASENDIPEIANHLQALGALYVMEGSTLGGQIISKIVSQQLGAPEMEGLSFFTGYGEYTEYMWQTFKETLDKPLSPEEEQTVMEAADQTFIRFRHWFNQHLSEA